MTDVIELGRHKPTPESVISRLVRYQGDIENISVVVEWKSGDIDCYGNEKPVSKLALFALALTEHAKNEMVRP